MYFNVFLFFPPVAGIASHPTDETGHYLTPVEQSAALSLSDKGE